MLIFASGAEQGSRSSAAVSTSTSQHHICSLRNGAPPRPPRGCGCKHRGPRVRHPVRPADARRRVPHAPVQLRAGGRDGRGLAVQPRRARREGLLHESEQLQLHLRRVRHQHVRVPAQLRAVLARERGPPDRGRGCGRSGEQGERKRGNETRLADHASQITPAEPPPPLSHSSIVLRSFLPPLAHSPSHPSLSPSSAGTRAPSPWPPAPTSARASPSVPPSTSSWTPPTRQQEGSP